MKENGILLNNVFVTVGELSALIYKIDLETMELGEEKERINGSEYLTYVYREEENIFSNLDNCENITSREWGWYQVFEEEEYEYEDIDPQF